MERRYEILFSKNYRNAATWENRIEISSGARETLEALTMVHWIEKGLVFKVISEKGPHGYCDKVEIAIELYTPSIDENKRNVDYLRTLYQKINEQETDTADAFSEREGLLRLIFKCAYEVVLDRKIQDLMQSGKDVTDLIRESLDSDGTIRSELVHKTYEILVGELRYEVDTLALAQE